MTAFEKISKEQFAKDFAVLDVSYEDIILPRRATKYSAGYDFFLPTDIKLAPGGTIKIPTGIRVHLPLDKFLMIVPRSSLGFKYRLQLDNTVGIIDADYQASDNEGHIFIKLTNDSRSPAETLYLKKGTAFAQGIILSYGLTDDDDTREVRTGGIGSTDRNKSDGDEKPSP